MIRFYPLIFALYMLLGITKALHADNGAWLNATGGDWNTDSNWTGAAHPDGQDAIAGFVGFPTSAGTITSTSNITVGSLVFNTTTAVSINLGNNLTFDSSIGNATIIDSGTANNTMAAGTPVILNTNLDLFITDAKNLFFRSSISGSGSLNLMGTIDSILHLFGSNSYIGGTFVNQGILNLVGGNNVTHVPGDITVSPLGFVQHFHDNHYSTTTTMNLNGGALDLAGTSQTMNKLLILNGGLFFDSVGTSTLNLLALTGDIALTLGSNSQLMAPLVNLINGGGIFYDSSITGTAFIPEPTTIDLQGHAVDFHVPHNAFNCEDVDIGGAIFQNGTLNKTGNGIVKFQGGTVPTFNIEEGLVVIGDQSPIELVTATGVVTVFLNGTLAGFQTLDAQAGLINSGTIAPGDPCTGCSTIGTLTIHGTYSQTNTGTVLIKGLNATSSDKLVVDAGTVSLGGELIFNSTPGAVFNPGDRIVVIDNTNEGTAISGTFSSFTAHLPPCLTANLIYNPHQVIVEIVNCPCPTFPLPPSNFIGVIKKCKFLNKTKCSLSATWTASPSDDVIFYRIYKDGKVVGTVSATSPLVFHVDHLHDCSIKGYAIAAVNSNNLESNHVELRRGHE